MYLKVHSRRSASSPNEGDSSELANTNNTPSTDNTSSINDVAQDDAPDMGDMPDADGAGAPVNEVPAIEHIRSVDIDASTATFANEQYNIPAASFSQFQQGRIPRRSAPTRKQPTIGSIDHVRITNGSTWNCVQGTQYNIK